MHVLSRSAHIRGHGLVLAHGYYRSHSVIESGNEQCSAAKQSAHALSQPERSDFILSLFGQVRQVCVLRQMRIDILAWLSDIHVSSLREFVRTHVILTSAAC